MTYQFSNNPIGPQLLSPRYDVFKYRLINYSKYWYITAVFKFLEEEWCKFFIIKVEQMGKIAFSPNDFITPVTSPK